MSTQSDVGEVRRILAADPVWGAYALADLQPAFAPHCEWTIGNDGRALTLIFTGLSIPALFTFGPAERVADVIARTNLPDRIYITVREEHYPAVERRYDFTADYRPMWRMFLPTHVNVEPPADARLMRLAVDDSERLHRLYGQGGDFAPDAFDPYQIENGLFFGIVDEDDELAAAGGTHIVDWMQGVAAIGNMYTRPDQRRQGHARQIVTAIVAGLRAGGVQNIVLNVDRRNEGARTLYERFGFVAHCPYVEGIGVIRDT